MVSVRILLLRFPCLFGHWSGASASPLQASGLVLEGFASSHMPYLTLNSGYLLSCGLVGQGFGGGFHEGPVSGLLFLCVWFTLLPALPSASAGQSQCVVISFNGAR